MDYETVIADLRAAVPEFTPHYADLPHVAFGELSTLLAEAATGHDPARFESLVTRVLAFVEEVSNSEDPQLTNLVKVSFLENLHTLGRRCRDVVQRLGPRTEKLLWEYEAAWGKVCPPVDRLSSG